jgi:hypothetical protein
MVAHSSVSFFPVKLLAWAAELGKKQGDTAGIFGAFAKESRKHEISKPRNMAARSQGMDFRDFELSCFRD